MPQSTEKSPASLNLRDLHHVAVPCRDAQVSLQFYCQVLGFQPLPRPPFDFPGAWLYTAGMQIHLIQIADQRSALRPIDSRTLHLAFRVPCLELARQTLEQHQVPYLRRTNAGGIDQVFFQDPDGLNIELTVTTDPQFGYEQG